MKRHIPNLITAMNVFCGSVAAIFAALNRFDLAAGFVVAGIIFDFFDGMAARALRVKSELGVQLDSLADVITSGLVPGIVMFQLLRMSGTGGWNATWIREAGLSGKWMDLNIPWIAFLGFLITIASAYRLAKFNLDENQVDSFIGLPTPANALWIISLPLILMYQGSPFLDNLILNPWFLVGATLLSAYLLNSDIRLFSLKIGGSRSNIPKYLFLGISAILLIFLRYLAVPLIVLLYIVVSMVLEWRRA